MHPLLALLLVPIGAALLLISISYGFAFFSRINDKAGIEEVEKIVTARGFEYQKCNVGSSWFVVHFQAPAGAAKARFRFNRKSGLSWERETLEKSISYKKTGTEMNKGRANSKFQGTSRQGRKFIQEGDIDRSR